MAKKKDTGKARNECPNYHAANSSGQCSVSWCPYSTHQANK